MILKRLSFVHGLNGIRQAINYIYYGRSKQLNKPKNPKATFRNLAITGININISSPSSVIKSFKRISRLNTRSKRKLMDLALAFNPRAFSSNSFNKINSPKALELLELARNFFINAFGNNYQCLLAVQADSTHLNPHVHLDVGMTNIGNLKQMPSQIYNLPRIIRVARTTLKDYNQQYGTNFSMAIDNQNLTPVQQRELDIIKPITAKATSFTDFRKKLLKNKIRLNICSDYQKTGISFDYYPNSPVKSKGYSYHVKASTLATKGNCPELNYDNLLNRFKLHQYHQQHLIRICAKILKSKNNLKSLNFVISNSPSSSQINQANSQISKIKALRRARIINNQGLGL